MCVYSMVVDHYRDSWKDRIPLPYIPSPQGEPWIPNPISKEEIEEFKKLLERAREYDRKNNQPDCELEEKKKKLLELAKELDIKIDFL